MKTKKLILAILLTAAFRSIGAAGGSNDNDKAVQYRVTAVSNMDENITSRSNITEAPLPLKLFIPNAFTPNSDDINDKFEIVADGIGKFELTVYNRWGAEIYRSTNPQFSWGGSFKGEVVQEGVYVYELALETYNKEKIYQTGTVTVIK